MNKVGSNKIVQALWSGSVVLLLVACQVQPVADRIPPRTLGVDLGPELVFNRPVAEVIPALAGATATGHNGRVGGELVFWSYRLADGREVLLHACADLEGVHCAERAARICPAGLPQPILSAAESGTIRELECRAIGQAGVGDIRPLCADAVVVNPLVIGLATCP